MATGFLDAHISVQAQGVEALLHHLDTALNPVAIAGFLGAEVDPYLRERAKMRFEREGDDVSGKWAPLKETTQAIREQMGYGADGPINKRTGKLEEYILGTPNRLTIHTLGATLTLPGRSPTGETKTKVQTAQQGKGSPRTVSRPVLGMNEKDMLFVLTALAFHVGGGKGGVR